MERWYEEHPNLASWALLSAGMLAVLAWSARDQALTGAQWWWLGVATVMLAGLCAWIISWEAEELEGEVTDGQPGQASQRAASGRSSDPPADTSDDAAGDAADDIAPGAARAKEADDDQPAA